MACTAIGTFDRADAHAAALPAQERDRAAGGIEPEQRAAREQHGIDAGYRHLRLQQGGVAGAGRAAAGDAGGDVGGVEDDRRHAGGDARVLGIADADAGHVGDEVEPAQAIASASRIVLPAKLPPRAFAVNDGSRRDGVGPAVAPNKFIPEISYLKHIAAWGRLWTATAGRRRRQAMRVACLGGGPAGLYFAIAMKLRDPGHEIVVVERNRPYDTFGWGVVLSDETLANLEAADPVSAEEIRRALRLLGRHRRPLSRHRHALVGARLLRHRPQAAAQHPAGPGPGARRRAAVRDRDRRPRALPRLRPDRGGRRRELQGAQRAGARVQARHRRAACQVHLARHARRSSTTPSPSSSRRRSTAGSGRTPTSSMPRRRPSSSSARRRPGAASASTA